MNTLVTQKIGDMNKYLVSVEKKNFFFYVIVSFLGCFVHVSLCTVYSFVNAESYYNDLTHSPYLV